MGDTYCCECAFKIFIFILILGPIIVITGVLGIFALSYDFCIIIYFIIIGWSCELGFCYCHGQFLIYRLIYPWFFLKRFCRKINRYFCNQFETETDDYNDDYRDKILVKSSE